MNDNISVTKFITTGAGSMVNTLVNTRQYNHLSANVLNETMYIWRETIAGYTRHKIIWNRRQIITEFVDISGIVVHTVITKF